MSSVRAVWMFIIWIMMFFYIIRTKYVPGVIIERETNCAQPQETMMVDRLCGTHVTMSVPRFGLTLFRPVGRGIFRYLSTFRAFELILSRILLVNILILQFNVRPGEIKNFSKLTTMST